MDRPFVNMIVDYSEVLLTWIQNEVDPISDADPKRLAKYILALIKLDKPDDELKAFCISNLYVFLKHETTSFVNNLIATVKDKSYLKTTLTEYSPENRGPLPAIEKETKHFRYHPNKRKTYNTLQEYNIEKMKKSKLSITAEDDVRHVVHEECLPSNFSSEDEMSSRTVISSANNSFNLPVNESCILEIRNIPVYLNTISHLNSYFSKYGTIVHIQVHYDSEDSALVQFSSHSEANRAFSCPLPVLNNRFIEVVFHTNSVANTAPSVFAPRSDEVRDISIANTALIALASHSAGPSDAVSDGEYGYFSADSSNLLQTTDGRNHVKMMIAQRFDSVKEISQGIDDCVELKLKELVKQIEETKDEKERSMLKKDCTTLLDGLQALIADAHGQTREILEIQKVLLRTPRQEREETSSGWHVSEMMLME